MMIGEGQKQVKKKQTLCVYQGALCLACSPNPTPTKK